MVVQAVCRRSTCWIEFTEIEGSLSRHIPVLKRIRIEVNAAMVGYETRSGHNWLL